MARALGCLARCACGWGSDRKRARLRRLAADFFADYDVVGVQELFTAHPLALDGGFAALLTALAAEQGLVHAAGPGGARWPSLAMDSGLLVLSRYPIEASVPPIAASTSIIAPTRSSTTPCWTAARSSIGWRTR